MSSHEQRALTPIAGQRSILVDMAQRYHMEPRNFEATLRATVVPNGCSKEQFAAFLLVAHQYQLNPIIKEIYAFPARGGGIQPLVSIDGWYAIVNRHPQADGAETEEIFDKDGKLVGVTCRLWRKDRSRPVTVTEYMSECRRDTDVWKRWPVRMLRHKAYIQAARMAFGISGVMEPDEFERSSLAPEPSEGPPPKPRSLEDFAALYGDGDENAHPSGGAVASASGGSGTAAPLAAESAPDAPLSGSDEDEAYQRGRDARASGKSRRAVPQEYRSPHAKALSDAWLEGWVDQDKETPTGEKAA